VGVDDQLLRYVADGSLVLIVQRLAVDKHPPARRLDQAEDDAEQRGLARTVRADDPGELALPERERDVAEHRPPAETHADALEPQQARRRRRWLFRWQRRPGYGGGFLRFLHAGPHSCSVEAFAATALRRSCTSVCIQVW